MEPNDTSSERTAEARLLNGLGLGAGRAAPQVHEVLLKMLMNKVADHQRAQDGQGHDRTGREVKARSAQDTGHDEHHVPHQRMQQVDGITGTAQPGQWAAERGRQRERGPVGASTYHETPGREEHPVLTGHQNDRVPLGWMKEEEHTGKGQQGHEQVLIH